MAVVIAILSAITVVSINGVTQRAGIALISSDLDSATKRLSIDHILNGIYPVTTAGACAGHIDGGVSLITNLAINPSTEVDTTNCYT